MAAPSLLAVYTQPNQNTRAAPARRLGRAKWVVQRIRPGRTVIGGRFALMGGADGRWITCDLFFKYLGRDTQLKTVKGKERGNQLAAVRRVSKSDSSLDNRVGPLRRRVMRPLWVGMFFVCLDTDTFEKYCCFKLKEKHIQHMYLVFIMFKYI